MDHGCRTQPPWSSQPINPASEADLMEGVDNDVGSHISDVKFKRGMVYKDVGICMVCDIYFMGV